MSEELKELEKITKILILVYSDSLEKELSKYATTDERKMVWVLINDKNMPKDMVKLIGSDRIKTRAIHQYLNILENATLIKNPKRKPPKKLIDFVPASWIELLDKVIKIEEKEENENEQ